MVLYVPGLTARVPELAINAGMPKTLTLFHNSTQPCLGNQTTMSCLLNVEEQSGPGNLNASK